MFQRVFLGLIYSLLLTLTACGGGNSSAENGDESLNQNDVSAISARNVEPGEFVEIRDKSISQGGIVTLYLNAEGVDLLIYEVSATWDGYARFAIPAVWDADSGDFKEATVSITLTNGNGGTVSVSTPTDTSSLPAGSVLKVYLEFIRDNYQSGIDGINELELGYGSEYGDLDAELQASLSRVNSMLHELNMGSELSISLLDGSTVMLDEAQLKQLDRILFSVLVGIGNEITRLDPASRPAVFGHRSGSLQEQLDNSSKRIRDSANSLKELVTGGPTFNRVQRQASSAISSFIGMMKQIVDYGPDKFAAPVNTGLEVVDSVQRVALDGLVSDIAQSIGNDEYGAGRQFGDNTRKAIWDEFERLVRTKSPVDIDLIAELSRGETKQLEKIYKQFCKKDVIPENLKELCLELVKHDSQTIYPTVSILNRSFNFPANILSGSTLKLNFTINGYKANAIYSKRNQVTIDWGDQQIESFTLEGIGGIFKHTHPYLLDSYKDKSFTITVKVKGLEAPFDEYEHKTAVLVNVTSEVPDLLAAFLKEPDSDLEILETGKWHVVVFGGEPPYDVTMNWDDGKVINKEDSNLQNYIAKHQYKEAGLYEITFEVTDSKGFKTDAYTFISVDADGASPPDLPKVSVVATDSSASEDGDEGKFTLTRTGDTSESLAIKFNLSGIATAGIDYESIGSSIIIPVGSDSIAVVIKALPDNNIEGAENIILTLIETSDYELASTYSSNFSIEDIAPVKSEPNWEKDCVSDNSQNSGGAQAEYSMGDNPPYNGRGLICSDKDFDFWLDHNSVGGKTYLLVEEINWGDAHPSWDGCFLQPKVTLASGAVIGGGWICQK